MKKYFSQVVVVGGGATGVGILRDLSMRGISALLFEQGDLAQGTSSRFHGLLHSGARYAVKDPTSAKECRQENFILKKIAPSCIKNTGGWFVELEGDDKEYTTSWLEGCYKAGIPIREVSIKEALKLEPLLTRKAVRIFEVPDAAVDGFKLVWANAKAAQSYGGEFLTYHKVERFLSKNKKVIGVSGRDILTGEAFEAYSDIVVNAAGAWAGQLAKSIGLNLAVLCDKGTLLAFNQRLFQRVINRLHPSSDGDIFVPHETITIFGTTSKFVDSPNENQPLKEEIALLLEVGKQLIPTIETHRIIRSFAGVRPLHPEESEIGLASRKNEVREAKEVREIREVKEVREILKVGREVSRAFCIIDHEQEDNAPGLISIIGGKFTTYRLMAEKVTDLIALKLENFTCCQTAEESLEVQLSERLVKEAKKLLPNIALSKMLERLGDQAEEVLNEVIIHPSKGELLCECELVTRAEVEKVITDANTHNLADVRRKTRVGMGTCQGAFCTYRALTLLKDKYRDTDLLISELRNFLNQRWKGIHPVLWGDQLRETELTRAIYLSLLDLKAKED